mgnify:CR=1 FL=1
MGGHRNQVHENASSYQPCSPEPAKVKREPDQDDRRDEEQSSSEPAGNAIGGHEADGHLLADEHDRRGGQKPRIAHTFQRMGDSNRNPPQRPGRCFCIAYQDWYGAAPATAMIASEATATSVERMRAMFSSLQEQQMYFCCGG